MILLPDSPYLQYSGRIDFENPQVPEFVYPCSYIRLCFKGTYIKMIVENHVSYWNNYLGVILDGRQDKVKLPKEGKATLEIASGLEDTRHELLLFKRMDSCHTFQFYGFELEDGTELFEAPPKPARRIEVYGDSVSAGEVSEAVDYVGQPDPEHDGGFSNSYYSYSWMTARKLNAEIHDIAQGGIALLDRTGWFAAPDYIGMESTYDKIQYNTELGEPKPWDFSKYRPHVIIVAIGQNDSNPDDYMAKDYNGQKAAHWRAEYKAFIRKLRSIYPKAVIILATTILEHDENWDKAIDQVSHELNDSNVHHFLYSNNGRGTPGHIRIPEAEKMSDELAAFIESLGEEIWQDE
ncbi:MAG: GDSL-type esterase/lipase family protein [Ruminococcus sp.]|nr:GDSL-type esterase/lipase family protein [Ruminococcus sp.]